MSDERLTPEGERIFRELDKLNELIVKVGFQHGQATEENGADICDVAAFQELGRESIDGFKKNILDIPEFYTFQNHIMCV